MNSNPDGYMIKGRLMPAHSRRTEKRMADYIEELEQLAVAVGELIEYDNFPPMRPQDGFSSYGIDSKILWNLKDKYEAIYGNRNHDNG